MINPPKNKESLQSSTKEITIWRGLISSVVNDAYTKLPQYITADLPTLLSTDRGLAWDTTLNKPVAWNGTSWNALY